MQALVSASCIIPTFHPISASRSLDQKLQPKHSYWQVIILSLT